MAEMTKIDTFIKSSPRPAWLATTQGHCVYANPALERLTGLNSDQINQADWRSFLVEEDRAVASASWQRCLATGTPYRVQVRLQGSDGPPECVELIAFGHKAGDGTELWLFTGVDVNGVAAQKRPELEAQIQATLNVIPAYTWYALPSGALVFVNERTADYLGLPKGHALRSGIDTGAAWDSHTALLHPDDREEARRVWSTCLSTGTTGEFTFRVPSAEGKYRWFLTRAEPLRANDGTLLLWIGVNLDIDDAKRAEDALRKSEKELRDVIDTIPAIVWSTLPDGFNTYVNKRFVEYSGSSAEQMAGSGWQALIHPDDLERHAGRWMEAVTTGKPHESEVRSRRSDGQYRWQLDRGVPLRDEDGNIVKWYGVTTDIEDRKRAEETLGVLSRDLQESKAKLEEAQRITHVGYWELDLETNRVTWSDETYRIHGLQPQERPMDLAAVREKIHPEDGNIVLRALEEAHSRGTRFSVECRVFRPTGEVRIVHSQGDVKRDTSGRPTLMFGTIQDITDRKRAEHERERLRQLEADLAHVSRVSTLGEMSASLAHEIKQPIAAAITSANSCIEWLAHEPPNLDRARAAAARIDKYGNRAAEIIDRIRSLYKKSPPRRELVDVNGIIHEMLTLLKGEANRYPIAMRTDLSAELPNIMVDPVQLQQVFMNLMLNAIEAMKDSGGELTVKSELQDGQLQFSVCDTGVGLPSEGVDQMFSAFFTTKPQGSGMGLAISCSIVESHGGRLWATANSGAGATFHFTLPIQVTESSPLVA
jgi:PAS domain S-box-containing protein